MARTGLDVSATDRTISSRTSASRSPSTSPTGEAAPPGSASPDTSSPGPSSSANSATTSPAGFTWDTRATTPAEAGPSTPVPVESGDLEFLYPDFESIGSDLGSVTFRVREVARASACRFTAVLAGVTIVDVVGAVQVGSGTARTSGRIRHDGNRPRPPGRGGGEGSPSADGHGPTPGHPPVAAGGHGVTFPPTNPPFAAGSWTRHHRPSGVAPHKPRPETSPADDPCHLLIGVIEQRLQLLTGQRPV
jgi:hypothetical protein